MVKPLTILYHHRTRSRDGQAVHIEEMIRALEAKGCKVVVVEPPGTQAAPFGAGGSLVGRLRELVPRAVTEVLELWYSLVAFVQLRRAVRKFRPDVLYERYNLFTVSGAWIRRIYGIPYLLEVNAPLLAERAKHGGLALRGLAEWSERTVWRRADLVLPVTEVLAKLVHSTGVPRDRIKVIPNGINLDRFRLDAPRNGTTQARLTLGFVGFLRDWHGLESVIELLADPEMARFCLLVVGEGPAKPNLEAAAARAGVASRVEFAGLVGRDKIADVIGRMDVALQPASTMYASPLKLFEYMAMAKAVVAPAQPNIQEVLQDGLNACLFEPDDPQGLRKAILRLVRDDALRERLGVEARRTIVDGGFTWESNADRVIAAALELASLRGVEHAAAVLPRNGQRRV